MSLPDYYKILEVTTTATAAEIKTAFRRLAKLYHPDKNTGYSDEEKFKQIKEAYETLSNPQKRARYDAKRNQASTFGPASSYQPKKPAQKSYSFTEEEARRRQYYQQHYKKTHTTTGRPRPEPGPPKANYELKQILISVPIAVALLLLIIRIYEKPNQAADKETARTSGYALYKNSDIGTAEVPYKNVFPKIKPDTQSLPVIKLSNRTGYDAIVFLKNDSNKITQNIFMASPYELFEEHLPPGKYRLYYWLGQEFSYNHYLFDTIMGVFKNTISVDSSNVPINIQSDKRDTFFIELENRKRKNEPLLKNIFNIKKGAKA